MNRHTLCWTASTALLLALGSPLTQAHEHAGAPQVVLKNSPLQVSGALPAPADGVQDLKFNEMFKMPVGPRGMEPTPKLLALDKQRVRIIGYMANQENAVPGLFIVAPLPVHMGDDDDSFADDMPVNSIFVHLTSAHLTSATDQPGLADSHAHQHGQAPVDGVTPLHQHAAPHPHEPATSQNVAGYVPGLISLTGTLSVGNREEADGRISFVRLLLDPAQSAMLLVPAPTLSAKK